MMFALLLACASRSPAPSCGTDRNITVFTEQVWQPVLGPMCAGCHSEGSVAGGTRLILDAEDMEASLQAASLVGDLLLSKPTGEAAAGHGGGTLITADSAAAEALSFWLDWGEEGCVLPEDTCEEAELPRRLRRLSHDEYDRTLSSLLGISSEYGQTLAADAVIDGFDNDADTLAISGLLADQYRVAAESAVAELDMDALISCDPHQIGNRACATLFLEDFGLRAFRRPLSEDELGRYLVLWHTIAVEDGFTEGVRWGMIAMLQSPHFLYRAELGALQGDGFFGLTDWEVATALSYQLWGTMPDRILLDAAEAGALRTDEQIDQQIDRMLSDERAAALAADFIAIWLQLDQLQVVSREGLTDTLRESMMRELRAIVLRTVASGGTLSDLMLTDQAWLDENMAAHYGAEDTGWVSLDERHGDLLTRGAVLATHGLSVGSGPIQRGLLVRERLLCEPLVAPPADLDTTLAAHDPDATTRESYQQHSTDPQCAACHNLIDPLGFAFENYDQLGQWRDEDSGHPVDASGELDGIPLYGARDLSDALVDDPRLYVCFDQTFRRWSRGEDSCGTASRGESLRETIAAPIADGDFTVRTGDAGEGDTLAAGTRLSLDVLPVDAVDYSTLFVSVVDTMYERGLGTCVELVVHNEGADPVEWVVEHEVTRDLTFLLGARADCDGEQCVFSGLSGETILEPDALVSFRFCA